MTARVALRSLRSALLVVALLVPLVAATGLGDTPQPISITVEGRRALVEDGSRLGPLLRAFDLRPAAGRLLDVEGHVLDRRADPGRVLVNGVRARARTRLVEGDVVTVVDGVDRTETLRRVRTELPGRRHGNPQYSLATGRFVRIDAVGRVSGIVVSTTYRPVGSLRRPPEVALTFDDGPWPGTTRRILHVLRTMRAKATFFVIGSLARRYPALVSAEIRAGMAIGNHSWSHPEPFGSLAAPKMQAEMRDANAFLRRRFGLRVRIFRPPGGDSTTGVVTAADAVGLRVVDWNVDPRDWVDGVTPKAIVHAVLSQVEPGSIIDLHDGGGDQRATAEALPAIIRGIRKMGLRLVTLR